MSIRALWIAWLRMVAIAAYLISVAASNGRDMAKSIVILLGLFFLGNSLLLTRRRRGTHRKGRTR